MNFDIYSNVRTGVLAGLKQVPYIGWLLSGLAGALWPDGSEAVWDQIREDIEAAIDKKITANYYKNLRQDLQGIHNVLETYLFYARNQKSARDIRGKLDALIARCEGDMPMFSGSEHPEFSVVLLPLFAQLGNIHLGALRDSAQYEARWHNTPVDSRQFRDYLERYSSWGTRQYEKGKGLVRRVRDDAVADWNAQNKYNRSMQLMVLDFQALWPSFEPDGTVPVHRQTREIYSDAFGTTKTVQVSTNADLAGGDVALSAIQAWGTRPYGIGGHTGRTVSGVQPFYGQTPGKEMGSTKGRSVEVQHRFDLVKDHPVVGTYTYHGDLFNAFELLHQDGRRTGWFPRDPIPGGRTYTGFDGHILSSITVMGISRFYARKNVDAAECAAYGFRLIDGYTTPPPNLLVPPAFQGVSAGSQTAHPLYILSRTQGGDRFDYMTSMVQCGAREGFGLTSPSPRGFLLPDNSLYPDAVPVYRMVSRSDPDRVMLAFSLTFYNNQHTVGWQGDRLLGYLLKSPSQAPSIAPPQKITLLPVYVLHADGPGQDRTMLVDSEASYKALLGKGWHDAGWPKPVGYLFNAT